MKKVLMILLVFAAFCAPAEAGRPISRTTEGFIATVDAFGDPPGMEVNAEGVVVRIDVNKETVLKKAGQSIESSDLKVGDKVIVNQMKQDGKIIYTAVDVL